MSPYSVVQEPPCFPRVSFPQPSLTATVAPIGESPKNQARNSVARQRSAGSPHAPFVRGCRSDVAPPVRDAVSALDYTVEKAWGHLSGDTTEMAWSRWTGTALLAGSLMAGATRALAVEPASAPAVPPAASGGAQDEGAPPDGVRRSRFPAGTPIANSIGPVVEKYAREHFAPCGATGAAVPCFPVTLEVKGRRYSVRETLDHLQFDGRPIPGASPTAADMIQHGANPRPTSAAVGFDPKAVVCKTKQLLDKIRGKSRKYYLYRVWDATGERAVLRDRPLDPNALAGSPHFRYLPLGEFGDECEAIKAYATSTHEARVRREAEAADRAADPDLELRSGTEPE